MATITSSYTVIPNEPTPTGHLTASDIDQLFHLHTNLLFIYKAKPNLDAIERLRDSLSKILVAYYPIAGRLRWIERGRWELNCNAKGVKLLIAESTRMISEYGNFSPNERTKDFIPLVDYTQPVEEIPLLLVQLTKFNDLDHGIVAIGVAWSHCLGDAIATFAFICSWAKLARGEALEVDELSPILDRSLLGSPLPASAPRFDHAELKPLPLILGSSDNIAERKKKTTAVTLKLTPEQVENLKKKVNDQSQDCEGSRPYSRFEAIGAYIWRCASKARKLDKLQPTQLRLTVDIRSRLNPPLPQNYFGNATAATVTPACYVGDIISNPLSFVAQKIREAIDLLTNDYIRSQHDFIKCQEQLDEFRISFQIQKEQKKNPSFFGNPNLSIVSWMHLPWLEADFGWGKPMYFGPGLLSQSDRAYIIKNLDGSIIISMHFQIAHMQLFTKFFWEDILIKGKL